MNLVDFYPDVRAHIGNIPYPAVLRAARSRIREFCEKTFAYEYTDRFFFLAAGIENHSVITPIGTMIERIESIEVRRIPLTASSPRQLDAKRVNWRTETSTTPLYYFKQPDDLIRIVSIPSVDVTDAVIRLALKPTLTAVVIDDALADMYYSTFLAGILAALFSNRNGTGKWFNQAEAKKQEFIFQTGIMDAKRRREQDHTTKTHVSAYGGI